ncbi:MAG: FixH family protein [Acidobacteriota bacterium]|jgi:hypothetical protein|nr:MAG: hypothetical protein DIU54_03445 [Acidobacteriota bacterium]
MLIRLAAAAVLLVLCACSGPQAPFSPGFTAELTPTPPVVGREFDVRLEVAEASVPLLDAAALELEGHMTHPGMAPEVARLVEDAPGRYRARIRITMAGEWVLLVTGRLANGRPVREEVARATAVAE